MMKSAMKKKHKKEPKRSSRYHMNTSGIIVALLLMLGAMYVVNSIIADWKYKKAVQSVRQEYDEIIRIEEQQKALEDGLSGSTPKSDVYEKSKVKLPIILYHYVEVVKDENDTIRRSLNILPQVFERQLKDLKDHGYKTYFVKEIPAILNGEIRIATRNAVLTFDDGYEDFYTYAFPLLKKYNTKATLYIVYDFIGRKGFLSKKQLSKIIESGLVEIGSHAVDHINLTGVTAKMAKFQVEESKNLLEEAFGIEIKTFAYPYGGYDEKVVDLVKSKAYTASVSVVPGSYHNGDSRYSLARYRAGMFANNIVAVIEALKK